MRWRTFASFNPGFGLCWVLGWNALMIFALWLNGGVGRIRASAALVVVSLATLSIPVILVAAWRNGAIRSFVFRPTADLSPVVGDLIFLALLGAALSIMAVMGALNGSAP